MSILTASANVQKNIGSLVKNLISPPNIGWLSTKFPDKLNCYATQKLINNAFAEQINDGDFLFLQDRLLQIEILDAGLTIGLSFRQNKIICCHFSNQAKESDVTLSINTGDAIQLIQQEIDPDTLFFQRKLKINGDTELAHHVKNTIDTLDPERIPSIILKLLAEYNKRILRD